ncbi:hypothetical protein [Streptomyces badius]|uniref:Ricin B lectin domain-containing protein n=1 Tax=Streptomyces badius TaxID=1941 RepID=A0ABQ2TRC4_STRBA|nr:hypothetical protein [Streptomyces badius]GGS80091.1 hypothetical protein GCM10010253_63520 [Streptomyces badius]
MIKNLTRCALPALALATLPLLATAGPAGADTTVPDHELPFTSYAPAQHLGGGSETAGTGPADAAEDPHPELGRTVLLQRLFPNGERRCLKSGAAWGEYSGYTKCDLNDKNQQFQFEKNSHNSLYKDYVYQLRGVANGLCLSYNPHNDSDKTARPLDCNRIPAGLKFTQGANGGWVLHAAPSRRDNCLDEGNPVPRGYWNTTCNSGNYQSWIPVPVTD